MSTTYNMAQLAKANALSGAGYAAYRLGRQHLERYLHEQRPTYANVQVRLEEDTEAGGLFGLPTVSTVHFGNLDVGFTYEVNGRTRRLPELTLHAVLLTLNGSKVIVKTDMAGLRRTGSVKELMGYGDYRVRLTGVLFSADRPDEYPWQQVNDLKRICEAPVAVPVINDLLNRHGIHFLAIEEWSLPPYPGRTNLQPFDITAVGDDPIELAIEDREAFLRDWTINT